MTDVSCAACELRRAASHRRTDRDGSAWSKGSRRPEESTTAPRCLSPPTLAVLQELRYGSQEDTVNVLIQGFLDMEDLGDSATQVKHHITFRSKLDVAKDIESTAL